MNKLFDLIVVALPTMVKLPVTCKSPPTVTSSVVVILLAYKTFEDGLKVLFQFVR